MLINQPKRPREDRNERAHRIAQEYISAERRAREKKTARLRALRLAQEAAQEK